LRARLFHSSINIRLKEKLLDFKDFCVVASLMKDKHHFTKEGLEQIKEIKKGMNEGRK
jgi:hypothetical protein